MGLQNCARISQTARTSRHVLTDCRIELADSSDAAAIAAMSRDLIEYGLRWRWGPARVAASIGDRATNVAVARIGRRLCGFGIMKYRDLEAHLHLLAVHPSCQGKGVGAALVGWLENSALTAGIGVVYVEARSTNSIARAFYRKLGYREFAQANGYYENSEDAVRLAKDLWLGRIGPDA
jgi:ribosomal-protein-alanine N-acetyltransferase